MAKILIADFEIKSAKAIKEVLESRDGHKAPFFCEPADEDSLALARASTNSHLIYLARDHSQLIEALNQHSLDMVFIRDKMLDDGPKAWLSRLRGRISLRENESVSMAILSDRDDVKYVRRFMGSGIADLFCTPLDWPLFIQKFDLLLTKKVNTADRQLYVLRTSHSIDMANPQEIEEISEFGLTVKLAKPVEQDEFVIFHSDIFSESGKGEVLARCCAVGLHPNHKSLYQAHFVYVGVSQAVLKNIRRWLRQQYALKNENK